MGKRFHESEFDDATQLKLAIFRGYIRKWLPVFLTARKSGRDQESVNVYDFFAGPGVDSKGNLGSPRIVQDELKAFCQKHGDMKAKGVKITLYFSDKKRRHIDALCECLKENSCPKGCCQFVLSSSSFQEAFAASLNRMRTPGTANLVIMDQFGVKEVTPNVVNALSECRQTDILFFISSSYIRRFAGEPSIQNYIKANAQQLGASDYKSIHRYICDYFRSQLTMAATYHLAPFSIKKGSNIYGVIFGSRNLYGLQKFLEVCWLLDQATGEANYDIDNDPARHGDRFLFAELNTIKKQDAFCQDLENMLRGRGWNNRDVYRYVLENGFLPRHAKAHLETLQVNGKLEVTDPGTGEKVRKGAFYLSWKHYNAESVRAVFGLKG